jgi:hypothetical protein
MRELLPGSCEMPLLFLASKLAKVSGLKTRLATAFKWR